MGARLLRATDYRRVRWKNDGGWTTELAAAPSADLAGFEWRISIADVERSGAFSVFPGCERHIALLEGPGMELQFGDGAPPITLDRRLRFHAFSGDVAASGRLLGGPVRDFNVIVQRDRHEANVLHRPLVGPMVFLADPATTWFAHLLGGKARLDDVDAELAAGESLLLEPDAAARNRVLSGGGELVIVKLTRR